MTIIQDPAQPLYSMALYRETLEAFTSGQLRVKYQDREIWYKSNAEMLQALRRMEAGLGLTADTGPRRTNPVFSKGL